MLLIQLNLAASTRSLSVADSLTISDSVGTAIANLITVADSIHLADNISVDSNVTIVDNFTLTSTIAIDNYIVLQDNIYIVDTSLLEKYLSVSDSFSFIDAVSTVSYAISDINIEGNKLSPDTYIELFDFDATMLLDGLGHAGTISYYTNTPTGGNVSPILWRGNNYYPLPFEISGIESRGDGSAPSRPTIAISNVNQFLLAAVLSLGDLVGMKITRWRTFYKFTDNGIQPNILMTYPVESWVVTKKIAHSKQGIQFEMSNPLDRPGLKLPRQQILRDQGFPGVSRLRLR
jgi:lambda family phage minor tail protein L